MKTSVITHRKLLKFDSNGDGYEVVRPLTVREFIEKLKYVVPERHMDDPIAFKESTMHTDEVSCHFDDYWKDLKGVVEGSMEHSTHQMWADESSEQECIVVVIDNKEPECLS